jgi:hypothetical protein
VRSIARELKQERIEDQVPTGGPARGGWSLRKEPQPSVEGLGYVTPLPHPHAGKLAAVQTIHISDKLSF